MDYSKLKNTYEAVLYLQNWNESKDRFVIIEKFEGRIKLGTNNDNKLEYIRFLNKDGEMHRDNGNPSVITEDVIMWHKNGKLHRKNNKPAIIRHCSKEKYSYSWFQNTEDFIGNHQKGFPVEEYFIDGLRHRDYDLPAVVFEKGHSYWYQNGLMHRDNDRPAIINGEFLFYYKNGVKYKEEVFYVNKKVNWIIKNPIIVLIVIFTILTFFTFFL